MSKQEKSDKARKAAASKAEQIIAKAYETVLANKEVPAVKVPADWQQPEGCDDQTWHLACAVRAQRDAGVAWWQIAYSLGLPGSAPSVAQGKSGASFARRVYAAGFGAVPRVQRARGIGKPQHPEVKAVRAQPKAERVEAVRAGTSILRETMTDDEVLDMLRGRHIGWTGNIANVDGNADHFYEQEADVHRIIARVEEQGGERCLAFKEVDRSGPLKWREVPSGTRVVRLSAIHTVR